MPRILQAGGLWQEAARIYPLAGSRPLASPEHLYRFPSGATVRFRQCQHDDDRFSFHRAQIPLLGFDQLDEFTGAQFWDLFGRCRWAGDSRHERKPSPYFVGRETLNFKYDTPRRLGRRVRP